MRNILHCSLPLFLLLLNLSLIYSFRISQYISRESNSRSRLSKELNAKGFGVMNTMPSLPKLQTILKDPCPCYSGLHYEKCCYRLHSGMVEEEIISPEQTVRARFSAYTIGNGEYLISTLHPTSDDYTEKRNMTKKISPKMLWKAWIEETDQASRIFDFLYFNIIPVTDTDSQKLLQKYRPLEGLEHALVHFQYIAVDKSTRIVTPVDEISLLYRDQLPNFLEMTDPFYSPAKFPLSKFPRKWYYANSVYEPINEKERNKLYSSLGLV